MTARAVLAGWLLGPPGDQRVRASQSLLALLVYIAFAGVQHAEVLTGLVNARESLWLTLFYLSGGLFFYALVRSGLNLRVVGDPALTVPQMVFGLLAACGSYAITGPARGAVMTLIVLILVFGMFALRAAQARWMAVIAFTLLSGVMLFKSMTDPARYPPEVEGFHFLFAAIVTAAVSALSRRMGRLRHRLRGQKEELEHALAQIRLLATQDELTGLANRRHMGEVLAAEFARQRRSGAGMVLALIDIDLFKRINDTHGHQVGDRVLHDFAAAARRCLRASDVLARWGGEEFLLMLPETGLEEGCQCVERIHTAVRALDFDTVARGLRVTFSAGLASCGPTDTVERAIERADQAMYRAKTSGRNCSVAV